jgi:hypothetical protein
MSFWKTIKDIFSLETLGKLTGASVISTVCFIGYLPEWSRHWSAFVSVIISIILLYNSPTYPLTPIEMSYILMMEFCYLYLLANIMVPIYRKVYKFSKLENITIDAFLAQILVLGMCIPAIMYINKGSISFISDMCTQFFHCSKFVYEVTVLFVTLIIPYFILRFFDIMEFWPTGYMFLYAEWSFSRIIAGLFPAIYSIVFIYLLSFLFFDLTFEQVIEFYSTVFKMVYVHFAVVFGVIWAFFNWKTFYIVLKKLGIIGLLDKYGFINMNHYDMKYFDQN